MHDEFHGGLWLTEVRRAGSNALLFQTKLVTKEFLGSHEGFGEQMEFLSGSLHQIGDVLIRRAKESKCYMAAFAWCKSALRSGSVGNSTVCLFLPGG